MAVTWITPTDVTPGSASSWVDVDLTTLVPSGTTGVILHIEHNVAFTEYAIGVRKNGSTDNRIQNLYWTSHLWAFTGLDASRIFECYVGHATNVNVLLVGYFGSESVFFTNGITKTAGGVGAYEDVNIASDTGGDTAIGAILEATRAGTAYQFAIRKKGSSDDRYANSLTPPHLWAMIGVDGSEIFEQKVNNVSQGVFLIGYMKSGATFHTNAIDRSTGTTGSYVDLPALSSGMSGALLHMHYAASSDLFYALRTKGSSEDIYRWNNRQAYAAVEADANRIIQQKISTVNVDIWELGEFSAGVTHYTLAADGGFVTISGTAATLQAGRQVVASAGAVAVSGTAAALIYGTVLTADSGSVAISGTAAGLLVGRSLTADSGSVTVSGQAAALLSGAVLTAESGAVSISGTAATLTVARILTAQAGSVVLTGTAATLTYFTAGVLEAEPGDVTIDGVTAALLAGRLLSAESGSVALTGMPATLTYTAGFTLDAESGAVAITGTAATLTYAVGTTLTADSGAVVLTGSAVDFERDYVLHATAGAYVITGSAAGLDFSAGLPDALDDPPPLVQLVTAGRADLVNRTSGRSTFSVSSGQPELVSIEGSR